jgi:hypothetical protein
LVREQVIVPVDKAGRLYRIQNENALISAWKQEKSDIRTCRRQKKSEKKYSHANHEHDANETHQSVVCKKQVVD